MHEVRIWHDELFLARPWGIECSCGWRACAADEFEAKESARIHKEMGHERFPLHQAQRLL